MHNVDWGPTLYAAAGGNASRLVEDRKLDGVDLWETLVGTPDANDDGGGSEGTDYGPRSDVLLHLQVRTGQTLDKLLILKALQHSLLKNM